MIQEAIKRLEAVAANANVNLSSNDDTDAGLDALFRTYRPLLRRIAIRKFNVEPTDVDDLVQQVFVTFIERCESVEDVAAYLVGGICNASRQYIRRRSTARERFCDWQLCDAIPDTHMVDAVVRNLIVAKALSQLGESCRETLRDYYLNNLSAAAIASHRGTSEAYVGRLLYLCRRKAKLIILEEAERE